MAEPTSKLFSLFPLIKYQTTASWTPSSTAAGAEATTTITVPSTVGLTVGDYVLVDISTSRVVGSDLVPIVAQVTATTTITVTVSNTHAATAWNPGASTLYVTVLDKFAGKSAPF